MSGKRHGFSCTQLYHVWENIRQRCNNKNHPNYKDYGQRGIKITNKWDSFIVFRRWAIKKGYNSFLQIDRKNNDGDYSPTNCRFVSRIGNMNNIRSNHNITAFGKTASIAEWTRDSRCKVNKFTLCSRILRGVFPEDAIAIIPFSKGTSKYRGVSYNKERHKYYSKIRINGKKVHLGSFYCERSAAAMYNVYAYLYHGEKAKLNDLRR